MTTRQGGGTRAPDYLYEMALSRTEDLMVQALPWKRIVAILSEEGYTDSPDTAKNWRREVQRRWSIEDAEMRPARKDQWRARLEKLYADILERAEGAQGYAQAAMYGEAIKVAKLSIVMDGVQAPVVVKHEGHIDVAAMAPHEREAEIQRLLAKRTAALANAPQRSEGN